jgi:hypothetical protein
VVNATPTDADTRIRSSPSSGWAICLHRRRAIRTASSSPARPSQNDRELVAAEAADHVARPDGGQQAPRHRLEEQVAALVAEAIVDRLEAIDVDVDHRRLRLAAGQHRGEALHQVCAIGQAGEGVLQGRAPQRLLGVDALGDVEHHSDPLERLPVLDDRHAADMHVTPAVAGVTDAVALGAPGKLLLGQLSIGHVGEEDGQAVRRGMQPVLEPAAVGLVVLLEGGRLLVAHGPLIGEVERLTDAFGELRPDVAADQVPRIAPEHLPGAPVHVDVAPLAVERDERVGHRLEDVSDRLRERGRLPVGLGRHGETVARAPGGHTSGAAIARWGGIPRRRRWRLG